MKRYLPFVLLFALVAIVLSASLMLRTQLMEDDRWVGLCVSEPDLWGCQLRATLGWLIHFGYIAYSALAVAVLGFIWRGRLGKMIAGLALLISVLALVLYSASLGAVAAVLALLRVVRADKTA